MIPTPIRLAAATLALALFAAAPAGAVNLLANPGFETITQCPGGFGWIYVAAPWDMPTLGTSDCLNACAVGPFAPGVPASPVGFQAAHAGSGYAGFILYSTWSGPHYREYIQSPLTSPLVANQTYTFGFWVSLADSSMWALDRIGAYFSVGAVGPVNDWLPLPYTPQVESPAFNYLTNASGWTYVSGSFVAAGGEDHVTIGNFHDDATTNVLTMGGARQDAYYFVDDMTVELTLPTEQACCLSDGSCSMQFPGECTLLGGSPAGPGTTCAGGACQPTPTRTRTWGAVKQIYR